MPTLDLLVKACHQEHRERPSAGDVIDWMPQCEDHGSLVDTTDQWRIIRVTDLSEDEATMLCSMDPVTIDDLAKGFGPRRRMYMLPLRTLCPGKRKENRKTTFDLQITRDELFASLITKDEELRDAGGMPIDTPEPDHAVGRDDR